MGRVGGQWAVVLGLAALVGGCKSAQVDGRLVDAMTGEGIGDVRIIATAQDPSASLTCTTFEATTDADGAFSISGLCGGAYALKASDNTLWLADVDGVPDGGASDLKVEAWRAPAGSGVYRLSGTTLDPVRTSADLRRDKLFGTDEELMWPTKVPKKAMVIGPDDFLVLVGKDTFQTRIEPLIPSEPRTLGDGKERYELSNISFIGARFEGKQLHRERPEVAGDKVITKETGDRAVRYIPGSALPEGRYALYREKGKLVSIVDLGASQAEQAAAE